MEGIIYKYTNKINGKVYIGQTIHEKNRINSHKNSKENNYFHNAIRKYGWDNFEYKVLFRIHCNNVQDLFNTLNKKEIISIKYFNSTNHNYGYNSTTGGKIGIVTEKVRKKLSNKIKKLWENEQFRDRTVKKGRKIVQISLEGSFIREWNSIRDACSNLNIGYTSIPATCNKIQKFGGNYCWMWKDEYDTISPNKEKLKNLNINPVKTDKVVQLSLDGDFIKLWPTATDAEKFISNNKKSNGVISSICNKESDKTFMGYSWMYENNYNKSENIKKKTGPVNIEKPVIQIDIETGKQINEFCSITEASLYLKKNKTGRRVTSRCCNGTRKTAYGFKWKFKEDWENGGKER